MRTRCALLDFAEPYLSRIRIAGNKAASSRSLTSADCGHACQKPEASSARRETTLQREIAVKNVSLGIFDPARCRRNPDFWGGFPPKPRSVLRNRQGIPRLSGVSSRAHEGKTRAFRAAAVLQWSNTRCIALQPNPLTPQSKPLAGAVELGLQHIAAYVVARIVLVPLSGPASGEFQMRSVRIPTLAPLR